MARNTRRQVPGFSRHCDAPIPMAVARDVGRRRFRATAHSGGAPGLTWGFALLLSAPSSKIGVMTDPAPAAVASPPAPFSLSECETRTLQTGAVAVLRPVTPDMPARTDHDRLIASIHHDSDGDGWVRGFWAGTWHFDASEADVLRLLDEDLQAGRVPIEGLRSRG